MEDAGGGKRQRIESGDSGLSGIEDDDQPPELLPGQIQAGSQPHRHHHSPPGQSGLKQVRF